MSSIRKWRKGIGMMLSKGLLCRETLFYHEIAMKSRHSLEDTLSVGSLDFLRISYADV
jgi:hypothetical protein